MSSDSPLPSDRPLKLHETVLSVQTQASDPSVGPMESNNKKKRKLSSKNTSGYRGISKARGRFKAEIKNNKVRKYLGVFNTKRDAALAYDRAARERGDAQCDLNFPDVDHVNEPAPVRTYTRIVANSTGYKGVSKSGLRFQAKIKVDKKTKYLGQFETKEDAAVAFDIAAIERGDARINLNFPDKIHANHVTNVGQQVPLKKKMKMKTTKPGKAKNVGVKNTTRKTGSGAMNL